MTILLHTLLCASLTPVAAIDPPASTVVHHPDDGGVLALREVDGDGRIDLVFIQPFGFGCRYQREDGLFPGEHDTELSWPGPHLAWDLVDLDLDGCFEIVTLSGEGEVHAWRPDAAGKLGEGTLLLESRSYLPHGISQMRFARDIDGNGLVDFVLPAAGIFRIHLQETAGVWSSGIEIDYEAEVDYQVGDPEDLDGRFGQILRIPWFQLEDVDGDGLQDLVSRTEDRIDFHLARPELSATPTWTLDLAALRGDDGERDEINLDDLFSNIDLGVKWSLVELDGQAPRDLVIQLKGTIKVYLGGSVTGISRRPDQVLKLSGNLLHFFARDVQGDELPDLQLVRGEQISLGRVLRWLILPGSLDFELFTYQNTAGAFSRKPTRRNTVAIKIPRLLSLIDDVEEIQEEVERQRKIPARRADLDGDGTEDDVVDVEGGEVLFFSDCAPPEDARFKSLRDGDLEMMMEKFVLDDVDAMEDGGTKTIDLGEVREWNFSPGATLRESREGVEPRLRTAASAEEGDFHLRPRDLNGDGRDDVVLWVQLPDDSYLVQFLVFPAGDAVKVPR